MTTPTKKEIELSLINLKKEIALTQKELTHITWAFTFHSNQSQFLLETNASNRELAETLIVFQEKLKDAKSEGVDLASVIEQVFLHYVINTNGTIIEREGVDEFDVFEAVTRYAQSIHVGIRKDENEQSILQVNNREIRYPKWNTLVGSSAAWILRTIGPIVNMVRYGRRDIIASRSFGFDEKAEEHTLPNAMILADLSALVYMDPIYVETQLKMWEYDSFYWIENESSDTQLFIVEEETHIIVCFRGTSAGKDALTDLSFFKKPAFGGYGAVHGGFQGALESVWDTLLTTINHFEKGKKIFICGHSLGAALALLAGYRLELSGHSVTSIYTYGAPRVGNRAFVEAYNERLGNNTFCHINNNDIVTQLPPRFFGFRHVGFIPYIFDEGHTINHIAMSDTGIEDLENFEEIEEIEDFEDFEDTEDMEAIYFESLDKEKQIMIRQQIEAAQNAIQASNGFLTTELNFLEGGTYGADFEKDMLSEHGINEYLFKLGCAIVDRKWTQIDLEL